MVSADHGHLFFATERDESMRIEAPGGTTIDLHRRCWVGRGGATPPGTIRVAAAALGYDSDLDLVFPIGGGVLGGRRPGLPSRGAILQELIIPVVTVRTQRATAPSATVSLVTATVIPEAVTTRSTSATFVLGGNQLVLGAAAMTVRPVLMQGGRQVGAAGLAIGAELDRTTGCVALEPNQPVTVAFILSDDSVTSLRIVVLDPTTDAELYRSPADIPVRLGVA